MEFLYDFTKESLQKYIENNEFVIYLHPQFSVSENNIVGAEALVRWNHDGNFISPGAFIPVLEQKKLITVLDRYLWECVFKFQSQRKKAGKVTVPISINVSREDLYKIDVYKAMTDLSKEYDIEPQYIHIEITESAFVSDNNLITDSISKLKAFGFKILIDDFGSGYSALNILKDIDADVLKLDMAFFDLNEKNKEKGTRIIDSVIKMAHDLKLGLIAEGVENTYQLDILKEAGCEVIQGYFFYRPMDTQNFSVLIDGIQNISLNISDDQSSFGRECYAEGIKLLGNGEYENALTLAKRAETQVSPDSDAQLYCDLQNLTGAIYSATCNELMALDHYLSGLSVAVANNLYLVSGKLYNNIGTEYMRLEDHINAVKYYALSLKEYKNASASEAKNIDLLLFKTNLNLCVEYIALNDYEKAEMHLNDASAYANKSETASLRFFFLSIQSELFMKTGKEAYVREHFNALVDMTLGQKDCFNNWDSIERLGNIALELNDFDVLRRILDNMDKEFNSLPEDMIETDIQVKIEEFRLRYFEAIGDNEALKMAEKEYIMLCHKLCFETKKDRATTIDYKIELKKEAEEQEKNQKMLDTDSLTGVGNRYKLEKDYKLLQKNADENDKMTCIGIIDMDYLKEVNDIYGHLQGDRYLKTLAQIVKRIIVDAGGIYRYGGDAFVVLLVDVNIDTIKTISKRIKDEMIGIALSNPASGKKLQTVSQVYAATDKIKNTEIRQIFSTVESELRIIKNNGGDDERIVVK